MELKLLGFVVMADGEITYDHLNPFQSLSAGIWIWHPARQTVNMASAVLESSGNISPETVKSATALCIFTLCPGVRKNLLLYSTKKGEVAVPPKQTSRAEMFWCSKMETVFILFTTKRKQYIHDQTNSCFVVTVTGLCISQPLLCILFLRLR